MLQSFPTGGSCSWLSTPTSLPPPEQTNVNLTQTWAWMWFYFFLFSPHADHYVVINLRQEGKIIGTKETKGAGGTNPVWNAPFLFDLPPGDITQLPLVLEFIVMQVENIGIILHYVCVCVLIQCFMFYLPMLRCLKVNFLILFFFLSGSSLHQKQHSGSSVDWLWCFGGGAGSLEGDVQPGADRDGSLAHHPIRRALGLIDCAAVPWIAARGEDRKLESKVCCCSAC